MEVGDVEGSWFASTAPFREEGKTRSSWSSGAAFCVGIWWWGWVSSMSCDDEEKEGEGEGEEDGMRGGDAQSGTGGGTEEVVEAIPFFAL